MASIYPGSFRSALQRVSGCSVFNLRFLTTNWPSCFFTYLGSALVWLTLLQAPSSAGEGYALLIGVNRYINLQSLQFCRKDATTLRDCLIGHGFQDPQITCLVEDANHPSFLPFRSNIKNRIEALSNTLTEDDLFVLFFSGHGVHIDGKSYFCPIDGESDDPDTLIEVDWVFRMMNKCAARRKLMLIDACRRQVQVQKTSSSLESTTKFAQSITNAPGGVLVMASCEVGQFSLEDPELRQGVFTHYVIRGLSGGADSSQDGDVSLLELFDYVNKRTRTHVARRFSDTQIPTLRGQMSGNFVLAKAPRNPTERPFGDLSNAPDATTSTPVRSTAIPPAEQQQPLDQLVGTWESGDRIVLFRKSGEGRIVTSENHSYNFRVAVRDTSEAPVWKVVGIEIDSSGQAVGTAQDARFEWLTKDRFLWHGSLGSLAYKRLR